MHTHPHAWIWMLVVVDFVVRVLTERGRATHLHLENKGQEGCWGDDRIKWTEKNQPVSGIWWFRMFFHQWTNVFNGSPHYWSTSEWALQANLTVAFSTFNNWNICQQKCTKSTFFYNPFCCKNKIFHWCNVENVVVYTWMGGSGK